jgi:hypothetical protein
MESRTISFTSSRLMYGAKAMTLQELKYNSPWSDPNATRNIDELTTKDLLDEDQVQALDALNKYQAATKTWRDKAVVSKELAEGDLILIRTVRTESMGKLEPKWECLFIIKNKTSPNSYRLASQIGIDLKHSWNIDNLIKYYL